MVQPPAPGLGQPDRLQAVPPHGGQSDLSHQIEHHLFPDIPAHRYAEVSVEVREACERYGLTYNAGPLTRQFGSVVRKIARLALPSSGSDEQQAEVTELPHERRERPVVAVAVA